ncbi:cysteine desulfurase family protein [Piscibacillus sp. B03]|uniref:cysteine desulfurase family protein n=1 Tax=Piscibacillus sp. B03 TaxID=3457430 RepID=UPI003FCC8A79
MQKVDDGSLTMIYLDNSATTKPSQEVLKSFQTVAMKYFANPSSIHEAGGEVEKLHQKARNQIATLLKIHEDEVIFTSGGTESNNLAIKGIAHAHVNRGNHIITTKIEHPAVLQVCKDLEEQGFEVTYLPVNSSGIINMDDLKQALTEKTILVSVMHVNNEIGSIQPIEQIAELIANYPKVAFHTDHVQGFGKLPLLYQMEGLDLVTVSGHKIHGLKGTGCLIKKKHIQLKPLIHGGAQEGGIRPGTENVAGNVSLAKAMRLAMEKQGQYKKLWHMHQKLFDELSEVDSITINSPRDGAAHIFNFSVKGFKPEVLIHALGEKNIYVSTKSACSSKQDEPSHVIVACGKEQEAGAAIRVSMNIDQDEGDIDLFIKEIKKILTQYKSIMG